jgi:hypothetical protein
VYGLQYTGLATTIGAVENIDAGKILQDQLSQVPYMMYLELGNRHAGNVSLEDSGAGKGGAAPAQLHP